MKTKILLLAIAILGSGLLYSQPNKEEKNTNCDKKVLKKIQRKMNLINLSDYLNEGEKTTLIITCTLNDQNTVEVVKVRGYHEELEKAIIDILERRPVKCEKQQIGSSFTFVMSFVLMPV